MRLAGADAWSNIQPHPASPAEREDKPFSSKAAELGHGACIPHAYRELLLPPSHHLPAVDGLQMDTLYLAHGILQKERDSDAARASSNVLLVGT